MGFLTLRFTMLATGAPVIVLLDRIAFVVFTIVYVGLAVRALDRAA